MKLRVLLFSTILLNLSLVQIQGLNQDVKWKGTIEYEEGIKVIKNPNEPLYGEITFELEEDLSIGNEEDENYMFNRVREIALNSDENIYVVDSGNSRIQIFNKTGVFSKTIGRHGQGPGEFMMPMYIEISEKTGHIYISDTMARKINEFDKDGNFIKGHFFNIGISEILLDKSGIFLGKIIETTQSGHFYYLSKVYLEKGNINTLFEFPLIFYLQGKQGKATTITSPGDEYFPYFSKIDNKRYVYGYSKIYELVMFDVNGNKLLKIQK